jgi:hypothetical protein
MESSVFVYFYTLLLCLKIVSFRLYLVIANFHLFFVSFIFACYCEHKQENLKLMKMLQLRMS